MKDFSKKITEKIKKDQIELDSKLKLNWKNYLFWIFLVAILLFGALFFSLAMLSFIGIGPELFAHLEPGRFFFLFFLTLPYLWLALLAATVFSGVIIFRKIKRGYRYNVLFILGILFLLIALIGEAAHFSKINHKINNSIPGRGKMLRPLDCRWERPRDGLVGGEIIKTGDWVFFVRNINGLEWQVLYSEKTRLQRRVEIKVGEKVGVIGTPKEDNIIEALIIKQLPLGDAGDVRVRGEQKKFLKPTSRNFP